MLIITPSVWKLANGCVPIFYIHQSPPSHTQTVTRAGGKKKRRKKKDKTAEELLREVEEGMLVCLKEIERLDKSDYQKIMDEQFDEVMRAEFENGGFELTSIGDFNLDDIGQVQEGMDRKSRISQLPEEFQFIAKGSPEALKRRKEEIKELIIGKVRAIRRMEEEDNECTMRCFKLLKEKLSLFTAVTKSSLQNKRLEQVCNNLQELCRLMQQRIKLAIQNHDEKIAESNKSVEDIVTRILATKEDFQNRISKSMKAQEQQEKDNEELAAKIEEFKEHRKLRNEHYANQLKAKGLEVQLAAAKLDQQEKILEQEKARNEAYRNHVSQLRQNEKDQKAQIQMYTEKFEQFEEALGKSDEMFIEFNERILAMEKANEALRQDHKKYADEKTKLDVKLIKAFDEKQTLTKKLAEKQKIKAAIEKECRALQAERAAKAAQR